MYALEDALLFSLVFFFPSFSFSLEAQRRISKCKTPCVDHNSPDLIVISDQFWIISTYLSKVWYNETETIFYILHS